MLAPAPTGRSEPPRAGACGRKVSIVWFRNDLRLHDHEALSKARALAGRLILLGSILVASSALSHALLRAQACGDSTSVVPVYVFDPREFGKSAAGFDKTGPSRCGARARARTREKCAAVRAAQRN